MGSFVLELGFETVAAAVEFLLTAVALDLKSSFVAAFGVGLVIKLAGTERDAVSEFEIETVAAAGFEIVPETPVVGSELVVAAVVEQRIVSAAAEIVVVLVAILETVFVVLLETVVVVFEPFASEAETGIVGVTFVELM